MSKVLPVGKLDSNVLQRIVFDKITYKREEVIAGPNIGEDCALVDFGQYDCVLSTDPITAAVGDIGRLSIHISCNDVASNGVLPIGILLTVMLPIGTTEEDIEHIMEDAARAAEICGVEIMGGHTEITPAVVKPVIVSTAVGRILKKDLSENRSVETGDLLYMTKSAGIEGTGIIACDFEDELSALLSKEEIEEAKSMLDYVSVIAEGVIGGEVGTSGMHDITEGGIYGAVWELCNLSGKGAVVYTEKIPVSEITKKICEHYDINYLRLISSGCMIMSVPAENAEEMERRMAESGIQFTLVGKILDEEKGIKAVYEDGHTEEIDPPSSDELYKVVNR